MYKDVIKSAEDRMKKHRMFLKESCNLTRGRATPAA